MSTSIDIPHEGGTTAREADNAVLVARALEGGPEAFGPIVMRYKDAVFGVALARLRNFHDAEDIAQTTFVEAFDRLPDLKDPARLGAWLRTITIHRCINFRKRRERMVDFEAVEEPVTDAESPDDDFERKQLRERVMEAVGRLSRVQRETVTLHYISEYTVAEVAAIQEVPVGTVKRRLHDARQRLKQDMIDMVEDVLKDNAPNEDMADRVFDLLCAYPKGGRFKDPETMKALEEIGGRGREGFARVMELPHWRSRRLAVHYLGREFSMWGDDRRGYGEGGPPQDFALERLKAALADGNWGVRKAVVRILMTTRRLTEAYRAEHIVPLILPMLSDESQRVRSAACMSLCFWIQGRATKEQVRDSISLPAVMRAASRETAPRNLGRYRWLLSLLARAHDA